jgi:regulator of ribosome biosynthesis
MAETKERSKHPVNVTKPTPYTFDLGLLLANDPNPLQLQGNLEEDLSATARDGAQALLNQLLSTSPIASTPSGVLLSLPPISTPLPREKVLPPPSPPLPSPLHTNNPSHPQPLPIPKPETTWARFARKKGIKAKGASSRQKTVYDEATGEWVPKWGYKGANKSGENDWIVEVDEKKERERKEGTEVRGDTRRERVERIKRQDRKQRANERRSGKGGGR